MARVSLAQFLVVLSLCPPFARHAPAQVPELAARLAAMTAVTGLEQRMVDSIVALLPGAVRDRAGNATLAIGAGDPRRLVACPLDEPGYVVSGIRHDGYLTLRGVGARPAGPLYDQQLEGHRVTIQGSKGPVPGVVAVRSIHLSRGRDEPSDAAFRLDDAVMDVGASSAEAVAALGIEMLAPVALAKRPHRYGDELLAAPVAGRRAACAALLAAARRSIAEQGMVPRYGTTVIAFVVESGFSNHGLLALANGTGPFGETLLLGSRAGTRGTIGEARDTTLPAPALGQVFRWDLPVRYADSAVETVSLGDATRLEERLTAWLGRGR